jgi:hypothetical protein
MSNDIAGKELQGAALFFFGGGGMLRLLSRHICSAGRPKKIAESGHVLKFSQQKIIIILYL